MLREEEYRIRKGKITQSEEKRLKYKQEIGTETII
jgi:hypothetical protein